MKLAILEVHMGHAQKSCLCFLGIDMHCLHGVYEPPPALGSCEPLVAPHPQSEASVKRCWEGVGQAFFTDPRGGEGGLWAGLAQPNPAAQAAGPPLGGGVGLQAKS